MTDCPTLLAVPAIQKRVGFAEVERLDLTGGTKDPDTTAELLPARSAPTSRPGREATA